MARAAAMDLTADTLPQGPSYDETADGMEPLDYSQMPPEDTVLLGVHGGGAHHNKGQIVPPGFEGMDSHVLDACPRARLTEDQRLQREVARRRNMELERRARIFDAKRRNIGMDKEFIDAQCAENAERRRKEKEVQKLEDREFMGINRMLQLSEKEKTAQRRVAEKAFKDHSLEHLHAATRDTHDINDKKAITSSLPARIGDQDPRCGPSSMQQFNGEDLCFGERKRQQAAAFVDVCEQQKFEKEMLKRRENDGDADYMQSVQDISDLRNEIEAQQHAHRSAVMGDYRGELLGNIEANDEKKRLEAEGNQELNNRELDFHASDDLLNELGGFRPDGFGGLKPDKAGYKGSTRDDRVKVREMQLAQAEDNSRRRAVDGVNDMSHQKSQEMTRRQLMMMEREKQRMRRSMAMEISMHNKGMVSAQKEVPKDSHKNAIGPEFFEQFGVGTR